MKILRSAFLAGSALASSFATSAFASETAQPSGATQPSESGQDVQQRSENSASDIVVTARRSEERLQDVPISIVVFNQQQLDNRNIANGQDLATYTPSLQTNSRFGTNNVTFAIRGFTQEIRTTASVGVYFADVVGPRGGGGSPSGDGTGPGAYFDLQNVQVLRGPQGTLFGRNTTGGAVLLVPQRPTDRFEGYIEGSIGNYNMERVQGVLNIPLGENARFRFGFDQQTRDGYLRNNSGIGPDDFNNVDYFALRGSLVVDLTPDLENYTIVSYSRANDNGPVQQIQRCNVGASLAALLGPWCNNQLARAAASGLGPYTVDSISPDPLSLSEQWSVINRTSWRVSDNLTIRNIAAYQEFTSILRGELFGTDFIVPAGLPGAGSRVTFAASRPQPGGNTADQSTFSEELQFLGSAFGGALDWQAGGYLEVSEPLSATGALSPLFLACTNSDRFQCSDPLGLISSLGRGLPPGAITVGSINYANGGISYRNVGIFAQGTYSILDNLKLTAGIRYTWDRVNSSVSTVTYRFPTPNVPVGRCTFAGLPGFPTSVITNPDQCRLATSQQSEAPTWLIGLDWNPAQDILLYAKYARGYRQGGVNPFAPPPFQTYDAEQVDAYEAGIKLTFRGAVNGTFNIAGFYNDFTNQIVTSGAQSSTNAATPTQIIINAGASRIYGVEVEANINLFRGFNLQASYAYLNTELLQITQPTRTPGSPYDLFPPTGVVGDRLPFAPDHKFTVTASYTLPLPESIGAITFGATYTYSSDFLVVSGPRGTLPGYDLLNLNVNWNNVGGLPVDASFFMTNADDEFYRVGLADQFNQGFVGYSLGAPRMYGFRLRYRFGS